MENINRKRKLTVARVRKFRALAKADKLRNTPRVHSSTSSSESEGTSENVGAGIEQAGSTNEAVTSDLEMGQRDSVSGENNSLRRDITSSNSNLRSAEENSNGSPEQSLSSHSSNFGTEEQNANVEQESEVSFNLSTESREESTDEDQEEDLNERELIASDSDSEEGENEDLRDIQRLRTWAIKNKVEQAHIDEMLLILRARLLPDLPKSAKTFLNTTSAIYTIEPMQANDGSEGEFVYFGIKKGLESCIDPEVHTNDVIELKFSVDGLPVNKSGGDDQLWPHLCQVYFNPDIYKPFPVSIFCGKSKPGSNDLYFEKFVNEINELLRDGMLIGGKQYAVRVKCFVCDTPARAYCKNTVYHGAKNACERCTVDGTKGDLPSTIYPSFDCPERSDETFRNQTQPDHHHGQTHLLHIRPVIDMIFSFVLDFMHLCCLGMMKKLIEWWLTSDLNVRLGPRMRDVLSDRMELLKSQVPCEFHQRKPKSTKKFANWKATQFRFFTLYCGPIVLLNVLPRRLYKHFLLFHVACRILCSDDICITFNAYAKEYLIAFFKGLKVFYGKKTQVLNAHHLIHLADDVMKMGCSLSRISAFAFDSFLEKLKEKLRTPYRLLAQICRRLYEENSIVDQKPKISPNLEIIKEKENSILKIKYREITICTKNPDNTVLLTNNEILKVVKILGPVESMRIQGYIYRKRRPIYSYPFDSSLLQMWEIYERPSVELKTFSVTSIKTKLVKMSVTIRAEGNKHFYVVPLLHHE